MAGFILMSAAEIPPTLVTLVVCDGVWVDPYSDKKSLMGVFSLIGGDVFPVNIPTLTIYATLTGGEGTHAIRFRLSRYLPPADEIPVLEEVVHIAFPNRYAIAELILKCDQLRFPTPGDYRLKVALGDLLLAEHVIPVVNTAEEKSLDS